MPDFSCRFSACAALLALSVPFGSAIGAPAFVTGGVSEEGRAELAAVEKDANLKLVFADRTGAYLADVRVAIFDARGATVLDTRTEGPWLIATLPPGQYRIVAGDDPRQQSRSVSVGGRGLQQITFS